MHHCGRFAASPVTRREMLERCAHGFGAVALAALLADGSLGATTSGSNATADSERNPLAPRPPHFAAKAKRVIFLYMDGGPSQVDTFDPKPQLIKENGKPFPAKIEATQFDNVGQTLASPWKFKQYGQSGIPVSDLFPHVAQCVDDLCIVRSMTSKFSEHTNANYFLHTGSGQQGRPSMGAWTTYGLGSECQELPGFVVINGGLIPPGGLDNFSSSFLPATYQGSIFKPIGVPVANIERTERDARLQQQKLALAGRLDRAFAERLGPADAVETAIANYELAYRMQTAVPKLVDMADESAATKKLYGLDHKFEPTRIFAAECLLARRLVERGVRFIELTCPKVSGDRWDQHGRLREGHENNSLAVDQPIAALLKDLKNRGLLDSTLVVWAGEFGRTPFAQGTDGRDHNPFGFTIWMAGGGVKPGYIHGATDEFGYKAIENKLEMHDLHATVLHLLGLDHTKITFRFSGRDMRLTDVHGNVVKEILA
jgi:hypothetical protein